MSVPLLHRRHRTDAEPADGPPDDAARVPRVHRLGALIVAAVILLFGALGFADGLSFFSTRGGSVAGLNSNGLLSTVSVVTAVVLVAAALAGPRIASTAMIAVGVLFLISALVNLAVLDTAANLLAFRLTNVFFSIGTGLVLLLLGAYGRVSGNLPPDSPYARTPEPAAAGRLWKYCGSALPSLPVNDCPMRLLPSGFPSASMIDPLALSRRPGIWATSQMNAG